MSQLHRWLALALVLCIETASIGAVGPLAIRRSIPSAPTTSFLLEVSSQSRVSAKEPALCPPGRLCCVNGDALEMCNWNDGTCCGNTGFCCPYGTMCSTTTGTPICLKRVPLPPPGHSSSSSPPYGSASAFGPSESSHHSEHAENSHEHSEHAEFSESSHHHHEGSESAHHSESGLRGSQSAFSPKATDAATKKAADKNGDSSVQTTQQDGNTIILSNGNKITSVTRQIPLK